ncbi:MAG: glycoside hydrolase family 43 protein [Velocimicrobium sp.]
MKKLQQNEIRIRDPFIFLEEDTYYLYGSTDKNTWTGSGNGFQMYKSSDLKQFEGPFEVFHPEPDFWGMENYWAPEISKYKGCYYMTASFKGEKGRGVQLLQADSPKGPFIPIRNQAITPEKWDCLDGTCYANGDSVYLIFCHEWTQVTDGEVCIALLSKDMDYLQTSVTTLFKASEAEWTIENNEYNKKGYVTDGPYVVSLQNGELAMIWSSYSKSGYSIGVSYSKEGIYGPWEHSKELLYDKDGGHGMIFRNKRNQMFLIIHSPNSWMDERIKLLEIQEADGKIRIIGGII